jgi:LysR substrate binding domain
LPDDIDNEKYSAIHRRELDLGKPLDIDVVLEDRDIDLIAAGIDVALRIDRLTDSAATARKIAGCRRVVVGTLTYFGPNGDSANPADFLRHQAIIYEQRAGGSNMILPAGDLGNRQHRHWRLRVSATEGVREAVLPASASLLAARNGCLGRS